MKKDLFKVRLFSLTGLLGFVLTLASCANEEVVQKATNTDNDNNKNLTTFSTGSPESRTTMDYSTGAFYWEAGDYIYVQDDNNVWRKSKNTPTAKTASFNFKVDGDFNNSATYKVYYPGKNGTNDQVTIPDEQTQTKPNSTEHFGVSGDCGIADATGTIGGKAFSFKLDHQAAYLVFQPYTNNAVLHNCYLTKIEVNSDNGITDSYTLNPTIGELSGGTGTGKQIILTTKGSGTYTNGFPLTNSVADVATNGAFMVIKPGTHTLKIRYWVKDLATNVEGTITKILSAHTFTKNKYYNMTASLDVHDYDSNHYCMWDAQQQYWYGYEWTKGLPNGQGQPTLQGQPAGNYPNNLSDPRIYNNVSSSLSGRFDATHLCATAPNANEITWYVMKGAPRWDADMLWSTMGHLYKGGMWFKKKSVLQSEGNYSTEYSADGVTDLRIVSTKIYNNNNIANGAPSTNDANKYFYLPAVGVYNDGKWKFEPVYSYWSSSYNTLGHDAFNLSFNSGSAYINTRNLESGFMARPFSDFGDN